METETLENMANGAQERQRYAANRALAAQLRPAVPGTLAYEMLRNRASAESDRIRLKYVQPENATADSPYEEGVLA